MNLFMIGTQRSGSNLLRLLLNQQPAICAPHPPHILERFMPLLPEYGELNENGAFELLVDDVCRMVEANPVPWKGVDLDRKKVCSLCLDHSLLSIYKVVYDLMAESRDARSWCSKSLANINYLDQIEAFFPDACYIYLYRDGRDVALSFRKAVVGEKSFYHIAQKWNRAQQLALAHRNRVPADRFFSVSYECLISDPDNVVQMMMEHFNLPYQGNLPQFNLTEDAEETARGGSLWANVRKPIMKKNTRKFLKEADPEDIRIFELTAGKSLDDLGYVRHLTRPGQVERFSDPEIHTFELENERLKAQILKTTDPEELRRRQPQINLIREIQARHHRQEADV